MRRYSVFDQVIEVDFRAFPALGWLLAGFEVRVGGQVFHPRLDRVSFFLHPITEFHLEVDGRVIPGMVRGVGHWFFLRRKRYSLVVGMSEVARDTQQMRGWLAACLATGVLWMIAILAVFGGLVVAWIAWLYFHRPPF